MDRLPPFAFEAEQAVIGCCLLSPLQTLPDCQVLLSLDSFYDHRNKLLWRMISTMPPDAVNVISLRERLKSAGDFDKIGDAYISLCQDQVVSTANLSVWIQELLDKQTMRAVIFKCTEFIGRAYQCNGDAPALLDELERQILSIRPHQPETADIKTLVHSALAEIERRYIAGNALSGLSTGLLDLDKISDGLHKGEMVVIAGFPATGKTALAVNIAVTNALSKVPAVIFSAEMRPVKLVVRSICSESKLNFYRVTENDLPRLSKAAALLASSQLVIEQANRLSIGQIIARARRLKQTHDIQLAVVDYIQLLTGTGDNREQEISSISKGIKAMAMELEIPVLALSQLTDDGRLRESRAIGQDADSVWKLENDGEWKPAIQPVKLRIEKCRDGATGVVDLTFFKEYTRFENRSVED